MRIGILTYYNGINYGAFAQVYSLQCRMLELGFNVEIIAYKNKKHIFSEYKSLFFTKNPFIFLNNLKKYLTFRRAQKMLKTTSFINNPYSINEMNFDVIIIGSDEVWNFNNDLFGLDLTYFGHMGASKSKLISYAASFGMVKDDDTIPIDVLRAMKNLHHISVRDINSKNIVIKNYKDVIKVLDPTLIYDFHKELKNEANGKYLLFYGITLCGQDKKMIKMIKNYAKDNGLRVVSVGYYHEWADENYINIHPFEWMNYIKKANCVVTNMFHGTIFSIKFNKVFVTIGSSRRRNKIESLLSDMHLQNRIFYSKNLNKHNFEDVIDAHIDYDSVNLILSKLREKSESFLIKSINS